MCCGCAAGRLICPTGQVVICLSSPPSKNFSLRRLLETALLIPPSRPTEGRIAIVTDAGRDVVDASGASDEGACLRTAKSCGPDAPTLASSFAEAQSAQPGSDAPYHIRKRRWQKSPVTREQLC